MTIRTENLSVVLLLATALLTAAPVPSGATEPGPAVPANQKTHRYDLDFSLEVEGRLRLVFPTYCYRYQDLSLAFDAAPLDQGYRYVARALRASPEEPAYGVGEGPFKLQHYILLPAAADPAAFSLYEESVVRLERISEEQRRERGTFHRIKNKDRHVNLYRTAGALDGFSFDLAPSGDVVSVANKVGLEHVRVTGGEHAAPHFFDLIACSLHCIPPAAPPGPAAGGRDPAAAWSVSCEPVIEGLVNLAGRIYDMPMKVKVKDPGGEDIGYETIPEPGRGRVYVTGRLLKKRRFKMSVRGLDGQIWLDGFCRILCADAGSGRILKDELWVSFGIERRGMFISLKEVASRFHYRLCEVDFPETQPPTVACSGFNPPASP